MQLSKPGAAFIAAHEGLVLRAYRDPVGIVTIGTGFTNRSRVFRAYWVGKHGRPLRMGDRIGRAECLKLLPKVADEEYGAAVNRAIRPKLQHHYDGATSMTFNCGRGAVKWRWARALRDGRIREAARLLRTTATTAKGRRLAGLVRRRKEEARLIEQADYGAHGKLPRRSARPAGKSALWVVPVDTPDRQAVMEALRKHGYAVGTIADRLVLKEVERFQREHGLGADGLIGPATLAKLQRLKDINTAGKATGGATAAGGTAAGGGAATGGSQAQDVAQPLVDPAWLLWGGLAVVAVAFGAFALIAWRRGWGEEIAMRVKRRLRK